MTEIQYDCNRDLWGNVAKDAAEKAHKNWKVKGLLGYDKQCGLYYECFEKPLKSFNQGSTY